MQQDVSKGRPPHGGSTPDNTSPKASQTLVRGLDILEAVAESGLDLAALTERLGLTRSTAHRLAAALVERRYLKFTPGIGYRLGPKLLELGYRTQQQMDLPRVARPHLERLAVLCEDTVHLGVLDGHWALYLDKIPGRRRIEIGSRIGERHPIWSTGLGKALILDQPVPALATFFRLGEAKGPHYDRDLHAWLGRMAEYALQGRAFDLEENEPQIRCVAAPIRGANGEIIAAISVSSAAQYMTPEHMAELSISVQATAHAISGDLGAAHE
jgi:DNA-binding IclR family transcriptional regulator